MPYEDRFKSVREAGPRPGTEPILVAEEPKTQEPEQVELALEDPPIYEEMSREDTLEWLREQKKKESNNDDNNANSIQSVSNPARPLNSILLDLEKMIVDEDGIFEEMEPDVYFGMIQQLIDDAKVAAHSVDLERAEYEVLKAHYESLINTAEEN